MKLSQVQKVGLGFFLFFAAVGISFYLGANSSFKLPYVELIWAVIKFTVPLVTVAILFASSRELIFNNLSPDILAGLVRKTGFFADKLNPAYQSAQALPDVEQAAPSPQPAPDVEQAGSISHAEPRINSEKHPYIAILFPYTNSIFQSRWKYLTETEREHWESLADQIRLGFSNSQIGEKFAVSEDTINNWIRETGLNKTKIKNLLNTK